MTSRRNVNSEKPLKSEMDISTPPSLKAPGLPTKTAANVPRPVVAKLLLFTAMMILAPIGSYFLTVDNLFSGNTTYAGATAAIIANVVLIGYVIVAISEDDTGVDSKKKK